MFGWKLQQRARGGAANQVQSVLRVGRWAWGQPLLPCVLGRGLEQHAGRGTRAELLRACQSHGGLKSRRRGGGLVLLFERGLEQRAKRAAAAEGEARGGWKLWGGLLLLGGRRSEEIAKRSATAEQRRRRGLKSGTGRALFFHVRPRLLLEQGAS